MVRAAIGAEARRQHTTHNAPRTHPLPRRNGKVYSRNFVKTDSFCPCREGFLFLTFRAFAPVFLTRTLTLTRILVVTRTAGDEAEHATAVKRNVCSHGLIPLPPRAANGAAETEQGRKRKRNNCQRQLLILRGRWKRRRWAWVRPGAEPRREGWWRRRRNAVLVAVRRRVKFAIPFPFSHLVLLGAPPVEPALAIPGAQIV